MNEREDGEQAVAMVRIVAVRADPTVAGGKEPRVLGEPVDRLAADPEQSIAREGRGDALGIEGPVSVARAG